jgi:putative aldouronate transport system substrate-binding protein
MMNGRKVDTAVNKAAFREGLAFINKLYKEGLLYNGSFTRTPATDQLVESSASRSSGL